MRYEEKKLVNVIPGCVGGERGDIAGRRVKNALQRLPAVERVVRREHDVRLFQNKMILDSAA